MSENPLQPGSSQPEGAPSAVSGSRGEDPGLLMPAATRSHGDSDTDALDRVDMARLGAGVDRALDDLMERHAGRVFNFLVRLLSNVEDANDLAQETFARVYRAKDRFNPDRRFTSWLYTIAGNLARNHFRWRSRHPETALDEGLPVSAGGGGEPVTPAAALLREERAAAVRAAVDGLPLPLREVVVLCEWEGLSVPEAAGVLDTTPKAIETKLYRARRQLRDILNPWMDSEA
ncbi:MAG: RNA polymerase sigma factor [Verrucomicrobiales bacterium]|nr:RNA polymerase sigma factor [Verrucomicrobiales bacterium]